MRPSIPSRRGNPDPPGAGDDSPPLRAAVAEYKQIARTDGQARELRRRIKSVQSTRKITKTMELVARPS